MTTLYYAGIGSRETPKKVATWMKQAAAFLGTHDYVLRSGGSGVADLSFEEAAPRAEIFIPWEGFQGRDEKVTIPQRAYALAGRVHPAWASCSRGARAMHARNVQIILGMDCDPEIRAQRVKFVLAYAPLDKESKPKGGTGQGIRTAQLFKIPVFNVAEYATEAEMRAAFREFMVEQGVIEEDAKATL